MQQVLSNKITDVKLTLQDLEERCEKITDEISWIEDDIDDLEMRKEDYEAELADCRELYKELKGKLFNLEGINTEGLSDGQISELVYGKDTLTLNLFPDIENNIEEII